MTTFRHLPVAITALQAAEGAPALARLVDLMAQSTVRLAAVESLLPPALRAAIQAGPIDEKSWCLMVSSAAAAAKTRQLIPALKQRLDHCNLPVPSIRVKVVVSRR